jgi:hypothetical protein
MSNTFWAVFFGSSLGTLLVLLVSTIIDEYRDRQSHKRLHSVLDQLEDADFDDWEE